MIEINYKKLDADAIAPTHGTPDSAGFDLYAHLPAGMTYVDPGYCEKIGTGIALEIPNGYFGAVFARSGLSTNAGLRPANCVGVIDSDYRGEIMVALYNDSDTMQLIKDGQRIAQLVVLPYLNIQLKETDALDKTERGAGAFGSTGTGVAE